MKRPASRRPTSRAVQKRPAAYLGSAENHGVPKVKAVLKASLSVTLDAMGRGSVPSATAVVETADEHDDPEATRIGWPSGMAARDPQRQASQESHEVPSDSDDAEAGSNVTL